MDWRSAIERAFEVEKEILHDTSSFLDRLYRRRAFELADHLNSELRGLAFASASCEALHQAILARIEAHQPADYERKLSYPFYTDAIIAAFNARSFLKAPETSEVLGNETLKKMLASFDEYLPRTVEASNAIRHHHDRAFGRVRSKVKAKNGQFVAVWGSTIRVTDEQLNPFTYEFSTTAIRNLMLSFSSILDE